MTAQPAATTVRPAAVRSTTTVRPTLRAVVVLVAAVLLWVLADLTRIAPARVIAAALLLTLLVAAACIALSLVRLHLRRRVVDEEVPAGTAARVQVDLDPGALVGTVPIGRGVIREHLPDALGGRGDLPLARRVPHVLTVARRGSHPLGPMDLVLRDVFGMLHLRRRIEDGARIVGLPVAEEITTAAARTSGIAHEQQQAVTTAPGIGEIGPIARPYVPGDDIRRIHWRASARTGALMTREDEPPAGRSALIVLDNRGAPDGAASNARLEARLDAEDRLVDHAASVLKGLRSHGWEVRVVDADGDEIVHAEPHRGRAGSSLLGREADAVGERAALLALADLEFGDQAAPGPRSAGGEHATGRPEVVVALGIDEGAPFEGMDLDRFAGRARHRTAIVLRPADTAEPERRRAASADRTPPARPDPSATTVGGWTMVRGRPEHRLSDLLTAGEEA